MVRQAATIVDQHGAAALTLSQVAADLGVATPSLYKHVGGLDDLVTRIATAATADLAGRLGTASRGLAGRDALTAMAHAYRRFAHEHPGTYPLTQQHRDNPAWAAAAADTISAVAVALSGYGITEDDVDRIRLLRAALHGFVDLERSGGFGLPASVDVSFALLVGALDTALRTAR
ncbi:MAG TPA: TetR-like C-terminal domain-containing protein [Cellulomonas sp.]